METIFIGGFNNEISSNAFNHLNDIICKTKMHASTRKNADSSCLNDTSLGDVDRGRNIHNIFS